jgi:hypothetical protein
VNFSAFFASRRARPRPQADAAFTIVAASVAYLQTTHTDESIFGRPLFEVFPDNPAFGAPGAKRWPSRCSA